MQTVDTKEVVTQEDVVRRLFEDNIRLAYWCVLRFTGKKRVGKDGYRRGMLDGDDLDQVALAALHRAATTFNPDLGIRFNTYATRCIQYGLYNAIRDGDSLLRLPHHLTPQEREVQRSRVSSIHRDAEEAWDLPDRSQPESQAVENAEHRNRLLDRIRRRLPPLDWACLWAHHAEGQPLAEIAGKLGVSKESVRQRIKRAQRLASRIREVA